MKCPFNNFEECLVQECPACVYEEEVVKHRQKGIIEGCNTKVNCVRHEIKYKFKSCKLVSNEKINKTDLIQQKRKNQIKRYGKPYLHII